MSKKFKSRWRNLKNFWLDLLFPINCLGCGQESTWLCPACFERLKFNGRAYHLETPALKQIFIAGDYDQALLAELIKKFKYDFLINLGQDLGRFLINFWTKTYQYRLANPLVIPVPLAGKRLRWRGFNQAEILADFFSRHFGYEMSHGLKRKAQRYPQASLPANKRAENVKAEFFWPGRSLDGRTILLIDDVTTTGATLNECALALKAAGAVKIYALVLAKG